MSATLQGTPPAPPAKVPGARRWLGLVVPAVLLAAWWASTRNGSPGLVPSPGEVGSALLDLVAGTEGDAFSDSLPGHVLASVERVYGAFFLACLLALPLGMLIGRFRLAHVLLDPLLQILRPVPVTAWLPMSMILFGLGVATRPALPGPTTRDQPSQPLPLVITQRIRINAHPGQAPKPALDHAQAGAKTP